MSRAIVVDMNLTPDWVAAFSDQGWLAIHWSTIGKADADDSAIMAWARQNQHLVFTHDLDFGVMLALTHETGPSVIQVRGSMVLPEDIGPIVFAAMSQHEEALASGALLVVDVKKTRVRILPL